MLDNINVLTNDLGPSQKNYYLIRNINKIHDTVPGLNIQVFTENLSKFCLKAHFAVMNVAEAWAQNGAFIATSLSTASKLLNYPNPSRKLFYVWDLEFIRREHKHYNVHAPIYLNKSLELVCRSKEHADLVENAFNRPVKHIVNNFDIRPFIEILNNGR